MSSELRAAVALARKLKDAAPKSFVAPPVGARPANEYMLPFALVRGTRGYIEIVVNQINGCYEKGWFDGCAVMMRRLVETLIIECFECYKIEATIKNTKGDFLQLAELIDKTLQETTNWNLGRNTKEGLPRLKKVGDYSAHTRRYNAHRGDIDKVSTDFRVVCEELLYISKLKK
jgi:hypothetical protein